MIVANGFVAERSNLEANSSSVPLLTIVDQSSAGSGGGAGTEIARQDALRVERLVRVVSDLVHGAEPDGLRSKSKLIAHLRAAISRAEREEKKVAVFALRLPSGPGRGTDWLEAVKSRMRPDDFLALAGEDDLVLVAYGVEEDSAIRLSARLKELLWTFGKLKPDRSRIIYYPTHGTRAEELVQRCIERSSPEAQA